MNRTETADRRIEQKARRQHGVFTYGQAVGEGFSRTMISRRLITQQWVRLSPEVYALATAEPTWLRQYKAAQLSAKGAALAGLAAAKLHGFDDFRTVRPEIVVPYTSNTRTPLAIVHRSKGVPTVTVKGIQVTSVAQTLFDIIPRVDLHRLE